MRLGKVVGRCGDAEVGGSHGVGLHLDKLIACIDERDRFEQPLNVLVADGQLSGLQLVHPLRTLAELMGISGNDKLALCHITDLNSRRATLSLLRESPKTLIGGHKCGTWRIWA